jgi:hypothetical protein
MVLKNDVMPFIKPPVPAELYLGGEFFIVSNLSPLASRNITNEEEVISSGWCATLFKNTSKAARRSSRNSVENLREEGMEGGRDGWRERGK